MNIFKFKKIILIWSGILLIFCKLDIFSDQKKDSTRKEKFVIKTSSVTLSSTEKYDLKIDLNNPFNPSKGENTQFKYVVRNSDFEIKLRIYSFSGEYITTLKEEKATKDKEYTVDWYGKDESGQILPSGIYLVNFSIPIEPKGITRKIIIKNK